MPEAAPSRAGGNPERIVGRGEAGAGLQVVTPPVQVTGQGGALDPTELRQVRPQVRTTPLHRPAVQHDVLTVVVLLVVPVLHVVDPLDGQTREEGEEVLVV